MLGLTIVTYKQLTSKYVVGTRQATGEPQRRAPFENLGGGSISCDVFDFFLLSFIHFITLLLSGSLQYTLCKISVTIRYLLCYRTGKRLCRYNTLSVDRQRRTPCGLGHLGPSELKN